MIVWIFLLFVGLVFYTYAGYPILLAFLAQFRSPKGEYVPITPSVTLLIAAYDEELVIGSKLDNSLALDYPQDQLQIVVAVDGSGDRTHEIVRQYGAQGVELSHSPGRSGKMAAINRAMSQARGQIVVFSDANNIYNAAALRELVKPFADDTVGAVSGAKSILRGDGVLADSESLYWKYESFIKKQETRLGCCTGVAGEILAIRRDQFEPAPEDITNDDFFMAMQLIKKGYRVVYTPTARSYERVSASAQDEMTRRARIVAGRFQAMARAPKFLPWKRPFIIWQIVSHKFLRPLVPLAMIGALLTNLVAVIQPASSSLWLGLLLLQLAFYGLALLGNQLGSNGRLGKILYLPTFLINSNWAALIGLKRYLTRQQTTHWQRVQRREAHDARTID